MSAPNELWPKPPASEVFRGLACKVVEVVDTEAAPISLLIHFFVAIGNIFGRGPYCKLGGSKHFCNLYAIVCGDSSKARKGTAWAQIREIIKSVDENWYSQCVKSGLSSGEGLVYQIRDSVDSGEGKYDPGISDKRILVSDTEFAATLRNLRREGNILSTVMRDMWDGQPLGTMTKSSLAKCQEPHGSLIGHITLFELKSELRSVEISNGFANRMLWVCVRRAKILPEGSDFNIHKLDEVIRRLKEVVQFAKSVGEMSKDTDASSLWYEIYTILSESEDNAFGGVTSRAEAQVMRLACIYALLDLSPIIKREHLVSAKALWDYCENSCRFLFGNFDSMTNKLLEALKEAPQGLTRTNIRDLFNKNSDKDSINRALKCLKDASLAWCRHERTSGPKSVERWFYGLRPYDNDDIQTNGRAGREDVGDFASQ